MRPLALLFTLCLLTACRPGGDGVSNSLPDQLPCARRYGLTETIRYRGIVEEGIILANVALSSDVQFRFAPAWSGHEWNHPNLVFATLPRRSARKTTYNGTQYRYFNFEPVPVDLVEDEQLGSTETSFVPEHERCVIFRAAAVPDLLDRFGLAGKFAGPAPSYEQAKMVAIILLHEAGHLAQQKHSPTSRGATPVNSATSADEEIDADSFAVRQIETAAASGNATDREWVGGGPAPVGSGLYRMIATATNVNELRFDPWGYFGYNRRTNAFSPEGYTHLNLRLRFEIMAYQLDPREEKRLLLKRIIGKSPSPEVGVLDAADARRYVGSSAVLCGTVAATEYDRTAGGSPTILYFERPYPNDAFRVIIWGADRGSFREPERVYAGKRLCVAGVIRSDRRSPIFLVVSRPDDIKQRPVERSEKAGG